MEEPRYPAVALRSVVLGNKTKGAEMHAKLMRFLSFPTVI